ncbi:MAG: C25 family cysteine peptidase [bacterium]|nr:C25 family cysteine peptidase [bacterium]
MKFRLLCFAMIGLTLAGLYSVQASFIPLRNDLSGDTPQITVLREDDQQVQFEICLPGVDRLEGVLQGQKWDRIEIPGGGCGQGLGTPEIPFFSRLLVIPARTGIRVEFEALETSTIPDIKLMPSQGVDADEVAAKNLNLQYNPEIYSRNEDYPSQNVLVGEPALMRGVRVVSLQTNPVKYNPVTRELKVATRYRVTVHFEGADLRNVPKRPVHLSKTWAGMMHGLTFNALDQETDQAGAGAYLIICVNDPELISRVQPLIDWKLRKGHTVVLQTVQAGATYLTIKHIIQNAYDTWEVPPEFVLLFGDVSGPYALTGYNGSSYKFDHPYSQLEGNDILPDVAVGRLPAGNLIEATIMVNKILMYEGSPFVSNDDWFHQSVLIVGTTDCGVSAVHTARSIKTLMLENGYTRIDTLWYGMGGSIPTTITNAINNGVTFYNYTMWLGMGGFGLSNIDALTNGDKLPFCTLVGEATGGFDNTTIAEHFVEVGSLTTNRGAIGAIGQPTCGVSGRCLNTLSIGFYTGIFVENVTTEGNILNRGKLELYNNYILHEPANVWNHCLWFSLAGDPGLDIYAGPIHYMTCDVPATIDWGENLLNLTVSEPNFGPVEDATVCLYKANDLQVTGWTNANGQVSLPLDVSAAGNVKVTITRHNFHPILDSLDVVQQAVAVGYFSHTVDDDNLGGSHGDGDQIINPGEAVQIPLVLKNFGATTIATGVSVTVSHSDPLVALTDSVQTFPDLAPGATGNSSGSLLSMIAPICPDGHIISLNLHTQTSQGNWDGLLELEVKSCRMQWVSAFAAGPDTLLSPGETEDFMLSVKNVGHKNAGLLAATLRSLDPFVTVNDSQAVFGAVNVGETAICSLNPFNLSASALAPTGYRATLRVNYTANGGVQADTITLELGSKHSYDPQGPDSYGYYCFDNTDLNYSQHPTYSWVEIDPTMGGPGTLLPIVDEAANQDAAINIRLPFTFRYYGETVEGITVCSNGWISTRDNAAMPVYNNSPIPSFMNPDGMIAPFWDNLVTWSHGHVFSWYDSTGHRYIVEWSRMHPRTSMTIEETFEVILHDPAYYPTSTGDGEIIFQYNAITEVSGSQEEIPYSTVGIEKPDHSTGIQVAFYNAYEDPAAAHLQAGRAYLFTPDLDYFAGSGLSVALQPYGTPIVIPAQGGSFTFNIALTNSETVPAIADAWCDVTLPNGNPYGPTQSPVTNFTFAANWSMNRDRTQVVPGGAPAGNYVYHAYVGIYPNTVFDESSFPFVKSGDNGSGNWFEGWINIGESFDAITTSTTLPNCFKLYAPFPNPFNPSTTIRFELPQAAKVRLEVFDINGRAAGAQYIASLQEAWYPAGYHEISFDGSKLASGIYVCRIQAGKFAATQKMVLLK